MKSKHHLHIYKQSKSNRYLIQKIINGETFTFGSYTDLNQAMRIRDELVKNNWEHSTLYEEKQQEIQTRKYYSSIHLNGNKRKYIVTNHKGEYMGTIGNLEQALYYRDLYYDCPKESIPRPDKVDLITDNPYLIDGLRYPVPERLIKAEKNSGYGAGSIQHVRKGSYKIYYSKTLYYIARTREQAYFVHKKLRECDWDRNELPRIIDEYPRWYTKLQFFYQYIIHNPDYPHRSKQEWVVTVPRAYRENREIPEQYRYIKLTDALHERDFLMNNEWNYNLLVECIDDTNNPYEEMELPPFPERKIRNLRTPVYHEKEINQACELIRDGARNQQEICRVLGISPVNLRNWLKKFNTDFLEFKTICLNEPDIWNVLEKEEYILQPDLSYNKPPNYKGNIHKNPKSKRSPYIVKKYFNNQPIAFGTYQTKKQAQQAVRLLKQCNWDKRKLPRIRKKVGVEQYGISRDNVYPNKYKGRDISYTIRKKDKNRKMINYGTYRCLLLAIRVKDRLREAGWDKELLSEIRENEEEEMIKECKLKGVLEELV